MANTIIFLFWYLLLQSTLNMTLYFVEFRFSFGFALNFYYQKSILYPQKLTFDTDHKGILYLSVYEYCRGSKFLSYVDPIGAEKPIKVVISIRLSPNLAYIYKYSRNTYH